jgi:hypothetical protein
MKKTGEVNMFKDEEGRAYKSKEGPAGRKPIDNP